MYPPKRERPAVGSTTPRQRMILLAAGLIAGYIVGMVFMETADRMFTTGVEHRHGHDIRAEQPQQHQDSIQTSTTTQTVQTQTQTHHSQQQTADSNKPAGDTIHSLLTSNGSPYQNFQTRIMYGTYKLVQQMPGGEKLTGFTRILHRMTEDILMDEVPTYRVNPLHPECDVYCDFPVADRPNAIQQWVDAAGKDPSMIKGAWLLLVEADYVPSAYSNAPAMQFHFDYIIPTWPGVTETLDRLANANGMTIPGPIPPGGSAPALLRYEELKKVTPKWEIITAAIEADKQAKDLMGWVREMYAWDVAVVATGVAMDTQEEGKSILLAQPPHDITLGQASICHYTWGATYNDSKGEVFKWEKREYTAPEVALKVPHIPMPPQPFQPNTWHLQDNKPVTKEMHETLTAMLGQMNKAIDLLPDLTGKVKSK